MAFTPQGVLSVFLISTFSILVAFYLRKKISLKFFLTSSFCVFLPTTLNETKITFFLLPLSAIFPAILLKKQRKNIIRVGLVVIILLGSLATFKTIYDHFFIKRYGKDILTMVSRKGWLESYANRRVTPVLLSLENSTKNMEKFIFGLGAGNVAGSFTESMSGEHYKIAARYRVGEVGVTKLIWETGIVGTFVFFLFIIFIFFDSWKHSKREDLAGTLSLGMVSCTAFFLLSFFYTSTLEQNSLLYTFFFVAGYIASIQKNNKLASHSSNGSPQQLTP